MRSAAGFQRVIRSSSAYSTIATGEASIAARRRSSLERRSASRCSRSVTSTPHDERELAPGHVDDRRRRPGDDPLAAVAGAPARDALLRLGAGECRARRRARAERLVLGLEISKKLRPSISPARSSRSSARSDLLTALPVTVPSRSTTASRLGVVSATLRRKSRSRTELDLAQLALRDVEAAEDDVARVRPSSSRSGPSTTRSRARRRARSTNVLSNSIGAVLGRRVLEARAQRRPARPGAAKTSQKNSADGSLRVVASARAAGGGVEVDDPPSGSTRAEQRRATCRRPCRGRQLRAQVGMRRSFSSQRPAAAATALTSSGS